VVVTWIPGLAEAQVGDSLTVVTVATTTTAADGSYRVEVDPTGRMRAEAAGNDGWVNFDVSVATADGRAQGTGFSRRTVPGGWAQRNPRALSLEAGGGTTSDQGALDDVDFSFAGVTSGATSTGVAPTATGSTLCSFDVTATPERYVRILNFHNASNANASWTYGETADSDIETAFKAGGGAWGVRGSSHVGNSDGSSVGHSYTDKVNHYARTSFQFTEGYYKPFGQGSYCNGDPSIPVMSKRKTATRWVGGVSPKRAPGAYFVGCRSHPQSDYRKSYPAGSFFHKSTTRATRIGAAVDVGPITVGGTSGYSTQVDMKWDITRGRGIWLCGNEDAITGSPGVINAQNRM